MGQKVGGAEAIDQRERRQVEKNNRDGMVVRGDSRYMSRPQGHKAKAKAKVQGQGHSRVRGRKEGTEWRRAGVAGKL